MKTVKRSVTLIMLTLAVTVLAILGVYFATQETGTVAESAVNAADITLTDEEKAATVGLHGDVIGGDHDHTGATALTSAYMTGLTGALTDGNYYLAEDIAMTDTLAMAGDINLCLNGHKLSVTDGAASQKRVIKVDSGSLTIYDCVGGGMITGGGGGEYEEGGAGIYVSDTATFAMHGGAVVGNAYDTKSGGGIYIANAASEFVMTGGLIMENSGSDRAGTRGAGICTEGSAKISGGLFKNNYGSSNSYSVGFIGEAVYAAGTCDVSNTTMIGSYSADNSYESYMVFSKTSVTMDNVTIKNGGGIAAAHSRDLGNLENNGRPTDRPVKITNSECTLGNQGVLGGDVTVSDSKITYVADDQRGKVFGNIVKLYGDVSVASALAQRSIMIGTDGRASTIVGTLALPWDASADDVIEFMGAVTENCQIKFDSAHNLIISKNYSLYNNGLDPALIFVDGNEPGRYELDKASGEIWCRLTAEANSRYQRADWVYGQEPTAEKMPSFNSGSTEGVELEVTYYSDDRYANEYTALPFDSETPVGTYYVKIFKPKTQTFTSCTTYGSFSVTPATITDVAITPSAVTYDGTEQASVTGTPTAVTANAEAYKFRYKTDAAGEYADTVPAFKNASEYTVYYEVTAPNHAALTGEITAKINKKAVTLVIEDKMSTYGDAEAELTFVLQDGSELGAGDTAADLNVALTKASGDDKGEYKITGVYDNANYEVTFVDGTYTIAAKRTAVIWTEQAFVYNGQDQADAVTAVYRPVGGGTIKLAVTPVSAEGFKNAGTYEFTAAMLVADANYELVGATERFTIAPQSILVTIEDKSSVYGNTEAELTYDITSGTLLGNDTLCVTLTKAAGNNTNEYAITGTWTNKNYAVTFTDGTYTITPKAITVTIENKTSVYGDATVALTYTLEDGALVDNDTLGVTLTKAAGNNAGEYAITGEWTNQNYAVDFTDGTYTITPRAVSVKINDATSVYGEEIKELTYEVTSGTVIDGDELNVTLTKAAGETVNEYEITGAYNNGNYTVMITPGTYTITKATYDMTGVAFEGLKVTYNGQAHAIEVTGLPAGVSVAYDKATSYTNAGEYVITATFTASDTENYNALSVTTLAATMTIDKAIYDMSGVAFEGLKVTYNGQAHAIEVTGLPAGVSVAYDKETSYTNAGGYVITATFTASDTENYNALSVTTLTATLTIDKAVYDMTGVRFSDATVTYNGAAQSIEATNLPTGVTVTYEGNAQTQAGTYTVKATFTGDANHEAIEAMEVTLTIKKAVYDMSVIAFDSITVTYDGASHSLAIAGTLPAGVTVTYENNGKTEVGTYTVIAKFAGDAENYEAIGNKTATLTINAQAVEPEKGGCGGMVMDGVTIGGIALAVLVVGVILIVRRKRSK